MTIPPEQSGSNPFDSDGSLTGVHEILDGEESLTIDGVSEERETLGSDPMDTPYAIDYAALKSGQK